MKKDASWRMDAEQSHTTNAGQQHYLFDCLESHGHELEKLHDQVESDNHELLMWKKRAQMAEAEL